jgi:enoyl-CoA hydratase
MTVQLETSEHIATITIAPSEPGGLIGLESVYSLSEVVTEVRQRDDVWAVVLSASGHDFCLGASPEVNEAALSADPLSSQVRIAQTLSDIEKPVVCAVQGRVRDQGLEVALACDLRIADSGSTFAMTQVLDGAMPRDGGTQRLPRLIGRSRAMDMLLTGRRVAASEALEIGLVNEVVGQGRASERAMELASLIAGHGPIALRYLKEAVLNGMDGTLDQGLRLEADLSFLLQSTQDRSEGITSFLERRSPTYRGQ